MGEPADKVSSLRTGDVVLSGCAYLLLERRHVTWLTWESSGLWWSWRVLNMHFHEEIMMLENVIESWDVLKIGSLYNRIR